MMEYTQTPESIWICNECDYVDSENEHPHDVGVTVYSQTIKCKHKAILYIPANTNNLKQSHDELLEAAKDFLSFLDPKNAKENTENFITRIAELQLKLEQAIAKAEGK